jgi:hypothetical protein
MGLMRCSVLLGCLGSLTALSAEPLRFSSGPSRVALIELYTSEGCSSCPPADRWLGALREKPSLWKEFVPLEFHVDYWNDLGWKDRLSAPAFTERQYAYASAWGGRGVYTPCFVRNGAEWKPLWGGPGWPGGTSGRLVVDVGDDGVCRISFVPGPGEAGPYDVHIALLGCGISSRVTAGENDGATLGHEFVVLGIADNALVGDAGSAALRSNVRLPQSAVPDLKRRACAAWVTRRGEMIPLQATGGWLP